MKTLPHIPSSSVLSRRASAAWRRLAGVCTFAFLAVTLGFAAEAPKQSFKIPAGDAAVTLKQFSEQSGVSVVFAPDKVAGVTTQEVTGRLSVQAAMDQLIAGTPLLAVPTKEPGAYAIRREGTDPNAQRAAPVAASRLPSPMPALRVLGDAAIVLSPFTVSTDKDTGYAATETLAGTRLRTDLRDVASSISVLTPELLRDLGATSVDEAVKFMPSVDRIDVIGNMPGTGDMSGNNLRWSPSQQFSIRGVVVEGFSSDFFTTLAASDFYNVERMTVSRGPNSILFGVGGPAGVAISSTKRANAEHVRTTVALQSDRYGSLRTSLDHNQPIRKGKLAIRINALHEQRDEFRENEGQWQDRLTLSATWKPHKNTTVTALHENWNFDRDFAGMNWWFTNGVLQWIAAGRPTVDFLPAASAWTTAGRSFVDASGQRVAAAPGGTAPFNAGNAFSQANGHSQTFIGGLNLSSRLWDLRYQPVLGNDIFDGQAAIAGAAVNVPPQTVASLLGIPIEANLNPGSRRYPTYESSGRWTQLFVEQRITEKLFVELAGNDARSAPYHTPHQFNVIKIDVAKYLPDGAPNPGYMQPYGENQGWLYESATTRKDLRGTLAYEVDATRWNRWLGRHHVSVMGQYGESSVGNSYLRPANKGSVGVAGWNVDPTAGVNLLNIRNYFVNGNVPSPLLMTKDLLPMLPSLIQQGRLSGGSSAEQVPLHLAMEEVVASRQQDTVERSRALAWQGFWLKNRLVTTFGVRKDSSAIRQLVGPRDADNYYVHWSDLTPANAVSRQDLSTAGTTRTFAGVLHLTDWLSLTYNQSANFTPSGLSARDWMGNIPLNLSGKTKDYGLKLYLAGNRLVVSANYFTNGALGGVASGRPSAGASQGILNRLQTNYREKGDSHFAAMLPTGGYPIQVTGNLDYADITSQGYELSVTFNPSRSWRMMLTGSRNTTVNDNQFPSSYEFLYTANQYSKFAGIESWKRFVTELNKVASGRKSDQFDLDPNNPADVQQASADALFIAQSISTQERQYADGKATDGAVTVRNGEYALNGVLTYVFTREGWLKGWQVGANARWRSAPIAGYYRFPNATTGTPEGVIDVTRPFEGDTFLEFGGLLAYERRILKTVKMRVQLNIENFLDDTDPMVRSFGTDSKGIYGKQYAYVPLRWEMRRPRNFKLTATFEF